MPEIISAMCLETILAQGLGILILDPLIHIYAEEPALEKVGQVSLRLVKGNLLLCTHCPHD
eukprot:5152523-Amphidinium_carterae.1